jgi:tRNA threonylcarbamoyladenosine biosynthesis protein TsaB
VLILGIDTATPQVGCAIGGHEGVLAAFQSAKGKRHAETLVPAIRFLCEQTGIDLSEIGAVAVDVGPGLFTGLRVGVATAKAMASALRVPMVPVSSLDLLSFEVRWTTRRIVSVVDARRGEVFYAFYRQVPGGVQRLSEMRVGTPEELCSEIQATGEEVLAIGDGALRYREELADLIRVEIEDAGMAFPSPAALVQLAHARALREEFVKPWDLQPLYLRKADAEINWQTGPGR